MKHRSPGRIDQNGLRREMPAPTKIDQNVHSNEHPIMQLQRTIGNRAVGRMLQAKLKVGEPGDRFEIEADQVADRVMRMPSSQAPAATRIARAADSNILMRVCASCQEEMRSRQNHGEPCPKCEEKLPRKERQRRSEERQQINAERQRRRQSIIRQRGQGTIRRKEGPGQSPAVTPDLHHRIEVLSHAGGSAFPESSRIFMQQRFGYDLSKVRIHIGAEAAATAQALNARAFTIGRNVVFGAGQYAPETSAGKRLLAHELAHVIQQQGAESAPSPPQGKTRFEHERFPQSAGIFQTPTPKAQTHAGILHHVPDAKVQRAGFFENLARFFGGGTFSEKELQQYLQSLRDRRAIEDDFDSDNKAREVVKRWKRGDSKYAFLDVEIKILLIQEMLSGFAGNDDENAILDLLRGATDSDFSMILTNIRANQLHEALHGAEQEELDELLAQRGTGSRGQSQGGMRGAEVPSREIFPEERVQEAQERFMENALLGEARSHCIKIIHEVLPGLFAHDEQLQRRVSESLRRLRRRGATYTIDHTGDALRRLGVASGSREVFFADNNGNHRAEPGNLESSAWTAIMNMVGNEVGWHIFGMSIFNGYHSAAVFVNHRPDGRKLVYWADQWAIGPGEDFHQEEGSASGFRRYEQPGFDRFIEQITHKWWCQKSTCDNAHWHARLTVWKIYASRAQREPT